ncbi:fimbrial protein [Enterobacter ludwigii]|uniref:fimbrial protein n=1 Tax=Enterobacter ludwigii TaxID=299767 RepID=UPI000642FDF7|nr:fimbrial protein [Enterobacter ludwigii]KLR43202.1 fimbrial adhesin [Enterobacter ludwigii]
MRMLVKSGCVFLVLWLVSFGVQASCQFVSGVTDEIPGYISFGNVTVSGDAPVGSVIATATTGAYNGGNMIAGCTEAWTFRWELSKWGSLSPLGNKIYKTNIPGVGLRMTAVVSGNVLPYDAAVKAGNAATIPGDGIKAELIKTGDIAGGTLTPGILARSSVANQFYIANVTLNGTNTIATAACEVLSPDLEVPLGDYHKSAFRGPGSTTNWAIFWLDLRCQPGTRVSMTVNAAADPSGTQGVMQLDHSPLSASGVGVQLWSDVTDSPVELGTLTYYNTSVFGGGDSLKFQARYYQTGRTVTAGIASATATFTMTYK